MRRLVEFSVENRVLVNLLALLVLGAGVVTYFGMHREMFPEFSRQAVQIITEYAGHRRDVWFRTLQSTLGFR